MKSVTDEMKALQLADSGPEDIKDTKLRIDVNLPTAIWFFPDQPYSPTSPPMSPCAPANE